MSQSQIKFRKRRNKFLDPKIPKRVQLQHTESDASVPVQRSWTNSPLAPEYNSGKSMSHAPLVTDGEELQANSKRITAEATILQLQQKEISQENILGTEGELFSYSAMCPEEHDEIKKDPILAYKASADPDTNISTSGN